MDDEPLDGWARRREERRAQSKGKLWAVPLTEGLHRGAHVDPCASRVIAVWNGTEWVSVGVVDELTTWPAPGPCSTRPSWSRCSPLSGTARHWARAAAGVDLPNRAQSP
ncbi:DUF6087 family protein [Streptomyces sp. NPDC001339]|uniref:DUF6087 family protein n=1 Tax=Streptomyces sp. NPDC001339 TaxID=3364563 RepID=UPI0036CDA0D2